MAPASWGVSDQPGWGVQLAAERVVAEGRGLGVTAFEAGPTGYLSRGRGRRMPAGYLSVPIHRSSLNQVDRYARYLSGLRADLLVVAPTGDHGQGELDSRDWAALFDAIGAMVGIAHRHELRLAVHPHLGSLLETHAQLERFLVSSEAELCVDVGDLLLCGIDPVELVELAPARVRHVHLKDLDTALAAAITSRRLGHWEAVFKGLFPPLGDGGAPVGELVELLCRHRYRGWFTIEQETVLAAEPPPGEGPVEAVGRSLRYLEKLL